MALADTVAALGNEASRPGQRFSTVEMKANLMAPARAGDVLLADGRAVHLGRRTQVWQVQVHVGERLGALFSCTQMTVAESS
jgi:uncharacterized protein (TIGR00369 family)